MKTALQIIRIKVIINCTILRFTLTIKCHSWETLTLICTHEALVTLATF